MSKGFMRCSICNAVSSEEIETEVGDYKSGRSFVPDPSNPLFYVCLPCADEIKEVTSDWEFMEGEFVDD